MNKNLITRIIVAAIFGPLIILCSYIGGYWLAGMLLLLVAIGIIEFLANGNIKANMVSFWITLPLVIGTATVSMLVSSQSGYMVFIAFFLLIGLILSVCKMPPELLYMRYASLVWGAVYLGLLYPFVFYIRSEFPESGGDWLLFLFGTIWLSDTLAMWVGKTIGSKKLATHVSPGKTAEGFIGGIFGGLLIAVLLGYWRLSAITLPLLVVAGLCVSIVGQLGDLVESVWKRAVGIKDSSAIVPGHGGILDRFDSLLFSAPILYWFLKFIVYG